MVSSALFWWVGMSMSDLLAGDTVRSHLRSVYTKLDVHTRQELLDFLKTVS